MSDHTLGEDGTQGGSGRTGLVLAGVFALVVALWAGFAYLAPARVVAGLPVPHPGRSFGIDALGGSRLVLQIDASQPTTVAMDGLPDQIRATLRDQAIPFADLAEADDGVVLRVLDPKRAAEAQALIGAIPPPTGFGVLRSVEVLRDPGRGVGLKVVDRPSPEAAMPPTIATIRRRVQSLGVRDPKVVQIGPDRILVEAPGYDDVQKAAWVATRFGRLTFQLVDDTVSPEYAEAGRLPAGTERLPGASADEQWSEVVQTRPLLTGASLEHAQLEFDGHGAPAIGFKLDAAGTRRFAEVTTENVGHRFAIVIDGRVISAPKIMDPITSGRGEITGQFTPKQANDMALLLNSGPMPAPVRVVEQSVVRPPG